jgi:hypothetical protein
MKLELHERIDLIGFILCFGRRSKKRCSASQKIWSGYPNLGEADPGGLGACPQEEDQRKHRLT